MPLLRILHWMTGLRRRRRARIRARAFPAPWRSIIERRVALWKRLPPPVRLELLGHILVFLDEKRFEGCGGQTIDDEVRVTIAAQACVLLLNRETEYFPGLRSILVYPTEYVAPTAELLDDGTMLEDHQPRAGESWDQGSLVLSWADVVRGATRWDDGQNVVLHEFAHQLDEEFGLSSTDPKQVSDDTARAWAQIFQSAYGQFVLDVRRSRPTPIDPYGATNEAEFFAVVTETFFERPADLRVYNPGLYAQWSTFFRQDPLSWLR